MEKTEGKKGIFVRTYDWFTNLSLKGLLGAIMVAFIIIIVLLSLSFLPSAMSKLSSSFSAALYSVFVPTEGATMTADKKIINSGEEFTINFKNGDATDGLFTVSYPCDSGAELLSVETGGLKKIECDTPYYLLDDETSIKIKAVAQDSVVRLAIDGSFENNETQKTEKVGVARVLVKNSAAGVVVTEPVINTPTSTGNISNKPSVTEPVYNTNTYPNYYGKPDLAVRVLQIGRLNQGTNIISNQTSFSYSDMIGIRFEIRNDGDAATGPWSFTAVLPSLSTPTYNSNTQVSLRPGESIIFTLGFDNLTNKKTSVITINADPQNFVSESIEYNNIASQTITNRTYNNDYYDDYDNYYNYNYYNNGCYRNGVFTYNCLNPYNNYYDYNYLTVDCYADPEDPETGDRVHWYADVSGGDGDYEYDWTGTNNLNSSSENPYKTYSTSGTKRATVTVTDGDDNEATATCSVYVD